MHHHNNDNIPQITVGKVTTKQNTHNFAICANPQSAVCLNHKLLSPNFEVMKISELLQLQKL